MNAPEQGDPSQRRSDTEKTFIRETIEPPKRNPWKHLGILILSAVLFGAVACGTFVCCRPWVETWFAGTAENGESTAPAREETQAVEETTAEETKEAAPEKEAGQAVTEEELEKLVQEQVDACLETLDTESEDGSGISVKTVQEKLAPCLVTVTCAQDGMDIFSNSYTHSDRTFGVILSRSSTEILVLTESQVLDEDGDLEVAFYGGETAPAKVRGVDSTLGIAVVSISAKKLSEDSRKQLEAVTMAGNRQTALGDPVYALGRPLGSLDTAVGGTVAGIQAGQQSVDLNLQLIQTDMTGSTDATGILVNAEGEMTGWITTAFSDKTSSYLISGISVSDLQPYIERISDGEETACLGIKTQLVTASISEKKEIPEGLYITQCIDGGAASEAGLQNGDILVNADGTDIYSLTELRKVLFRSEAGALIDVTVMRKGRGGYTRVTCQVALGSR